MLNISVTESGERLYIHPVAVSTKHMTGKVIYFHGREFPLYKNMLVLQHSWVTQLLNRKQKFYYLYLKRFLLTCKDVIHDLFYYRDTVPLRIFWTYYRINNIPIFASETFDGYITVHHQLSLNDPDGWTDGVFYLNPSQKYLQTRMVEWLDNTDLYDTEIQEEFLEWKKSVESKGLRVVYLCSLDT